MLWELMRLYDWRIITCPTPAFEMLGEVGHISRLPQFHMAGLSWSLLLLVPVPIQILRQQGFGIICHLLVSFIPWSLVDIPDQQ